LRIDDRDPPEKSRADEVEKIVPEGCTIHPAALISRVRNEDHDRAEVYELWCKSEKRAVWFTCGHADLLDDQQDPLGLPHFFPCPRPVYATLRTDSLVPIPDYVEYQDQAAELSRLKAALTTYEAADNSWRSSSASINEWLRCV